MVDQTWQRLLALRSEDGQHPLFPGAVLLAGTDRQLIDQRVGGWACCYADVAGQLLPAADRVPMRSDTIFDLASISKLFTAIVVLRLVAEGQIELDRPVSDDLPDFAGAGKATITVRQLLVHTSGFPAEIPLWRLYPDPPTRLRGALAAELVAEPGQAYCYSDLNLITLGALAQRRTGAGLDELVRTMITEPLAMIDTGYRRTGDRSGHEPEELERIAATEYQHGSGRGLIRGVVHDENAWSLGGVAGHAGVFSTAADLAKLAVTMINRGVHAGGRLLPDDLFDEMITNQTTDFPGHDHGLGFELNQPWYMGRLASPDTIGHTGFTGTSLVIDLSRRAYLILLTNRVHPTRTWGKINNARAIAADGFADLLATR